MFLLAAADESAAPFGGRRNIGAYARYSVLSVAVNTPWLIALVMSHARNAAVFENPAN